MRRDRRRARNRGLGDPRRGPSHAGRPFASDDGQHQAERRRRALPEGCRLGKSDVATAADTIESLPDTIPAKDATGCTMILFMFPSRHGRWQRDRMDGRNVESGDRVHEDLERL